MITPLDDRIVIQQAPAKTETDGGIVLPDGSQKRQKRGTVIAAGPGHILQSGVRAELSVKPGDEVLFSEYAGTPIEIDGEHYLIVQEIDVLAVIMGGA